ncbi:MAG: response regulator [Bacteroidota bacterium]
MQPRVLVVDDDINILSAFEDFLRKEHCVMVSASTTEEAMAHVQKERINLLITDIRLKAKSGVTLFLNAKVIRPDLHVIVITGYPDAIDEKEAHALGADHLLLKPLELEKLRQAVRSCLHAA